MIVEENLYDFLKVGEFRNLPFGITRQVLLKMLGDTSWKSYTSKKKQFPSIYKYDMFEFYFDTPLNSGVLNGIMYQPTLIAADSGNFRCHCGSWTEKTDMIQVIEDLNGANVKFALKEYEWDNEMKLISTEGGVNMYFEFNRTLSVFLLNKAGKFLSP